jgi:DNA-binding NarL/FixJ family response regulator
MLKVILVEDSVVMRNVFRTLLAGVSGLSLAGEFCSASAAIAGVRRDPPDILLLDIQLRSGNGMDVLRIVAAEYSETKVIVVTNFADPVYRRHYSNAGAHGFYDKSRELNALRFWLENLVAESPV